MHTSMQRIRAAIRPHGAALVALIAKESAETGVPKFATGQFVPNPVNPVNPVVPATGTRWFSSSPMPGDEDTKDAGDDGKNGREDGNATSTSSTSSTSEEQEPSPSPAEAARQRQKELVEQGFTPRQAAWMRPDPSLARLPRLTRSEAGSYGRPDMVAQYVKETQQGMHLPKSVSMYNLDAAIPEILEPSCPEYDALLAELAARPDASVEDIARAMGMDVVAVPTPEANAPSVTWTYRNVLVPVAAGEVHPVNSKVVVEFHLKDMQAAYGLTDDGASYVAEICAGRYDVRTGVVRLVGDRFQSREENRAELQRVMRALVEQGLTKGKVNGKAEGKAKVVRKKKVAVDS